MPFNGAGQFVPVASPQFPAVSGSLIKSGDYNAVINDLMNNGLSVCVTRNGQSPPTANLPMGGFKLTGLAQGTTSGDSINFDQWLSLGNGRPQLIANIATLRAATASTLTASAVQTVGYYTTAVNVSPDGGAALYNYDSSDTTSADNGGTIIVDASSRRWKMMMFSTRNIKQFGAKGDGIADDTTPINNSIASLGTFGGDIEVPSGWNFLVAGTLNFTNLNGVRLVGHGGPTAGAGPGSRLTFTATAGSRCIDARSTYGVHFKNLWIVQNGVGFTGAVIDYNHSVAATDSAFGLVSDCFISCVSTANSVDLGQAIDTQIVFNTFSGGGRAIYGGNGGYSNRILVQGNTFVGITTQPIEIINAASSVWTIVSNTFEQLASGAAAAFKAPGLSGLVYQGNYHGDANTSGIWMNLTGGVSGVDISGNIFGAGATSIQAAGATAFSAVSIHNNVFSSVAKAVDISGATGGFYGDIYPNFYYSVTTPLTGSLSGGRYQANSGVPTYLAGSHQFATNAAHGIGTVESGTAWKISGVGAGGLPLAVQASASQTANLTEWRDSTNAVLTRIRPNGGLQLQVPEASFYAAFLQNTSATNPYGVAINYSGVTGGAGQPFLIAADSGATRLQILGNGNVQNVNNSYGAISDEKLKDNIVPATPKLADMLKIEIVNYTLKGDPTGKKHLGVTAQKLEKIFPGLVEDIPDVRIVDKVIQRVIPAHRNKEGKLVDETTIDQVVHTVEPIGTVTKSVKYSILVPMLVKSLQELNEKVEALARVH